MPTDTPERAARVHDLSNGVDWDRLLLLAHRHRVAPLVSHALERCGVSAPVNVSKRLRATADETAHFSMRVAAECRRLLLAFEAAGLSVIFLKGLALGKLAYGNIRLKQGWDIDILVRRHEVEAAMAVLESLTYKCTVPGEKLSHSEIIRFHDRSKESTWHSEQFETHVELHTGLTDNPYVLKDVDPFEDSSTIEIVPNLFIPTLPSELLFPYLCVHGANSAWFRLKWIADLARLIIDKSSEQIFDLLYRSEKVGAGRAAAQALLLCDSLFSIRIGEEVKSNLYSSFSNRVLLAISLSLLDPRDPSSEIYDKPLGTFPIHLAQLLLIPSWQYKWSELWRQGRASLARLSR